MMFDNTQATAEGWFISEVGHEGHHYRLERHDEVEIFSGDPEAWDFVCDKATKDLSLYHMQALHFLKTWSPKEYQLIQAHRTKPPRVKTIYEVLDEWDVIPPGCWENEDGPKEWYAVCNTEGIVAYFAKEDDACRFRLAEVNRELNK